MGTKGTRTRRTLAFALVLAMVAALGALLPQIAAAAPVEATIGLTDLQTKIDAAPEGRLAGYFKTVLKGSTIETIPVDILDITTVVNSDGSGMPPKLILFEAKGDAIDRIGGIASGMSGSPIFVDDGGVDKLVGAVSYGDVFTTHNTGLATPIECMSAIESLYPVAPATLSLNRTIRIAGADVSRVLVSPDHALAATVVHGADTIVASPLATMQLSGIPASSKLFKAWQAHLSKRGMNLVAAASSGYDPSFTTTLTGGAAVGALASSGDMVFGAAGTVTYATPNTLVAFGHPLFWTGPSGMLLTNAWVDAIWPSTYEPYKLITPTAPRGTLTQDRSAGIAGRLDVVPEETTVTSHADFVDEGTSANATTYVPRWVADSSDYSFIGLPGAAAFVAPYKVQDTMMFAGSATSTATVVVSDGTSTYTIVRSDLFDDPQDIASYTGMDAYDMVYRLQSLNAPDIHKAHIVSVDLKTTMSRVRRGATVIDVTVPGGLKTGSNTVRTTLRLRDGSRQVVQTGLYIPRGTSLNGYLTAGDPGYGDMMSADGSIDYFDTPSTDPAETDLSVAQLAAQLRSRAKNTDLQIAYTPMGGTGGATPDVTAKSATTSFLRGTVEKSTTQMLLFSSATSIGYGGSVQLMGMVEGASSDATVTIVKRVPGSADATIAVLHQPSMDSEESSLFMYTVRGLTTNATFIARYAGDADTLPSESSVSIRTAARVTCGASPSRAPYGTTFNLTSNIYPTQPSGTITFEVLSGTTWRALKTVNLTSGKTASFSWKPGRGTFKVRARFSGSTLNPGTASAVGSVVIY
jgi:hypothetical protein